MTRNFFNNEDGISRYWNINILEKTFIITEGEMGLSPKVSTMEYRTVDKCLKEAHFKIDAIRNKGYVEEISEYQEFPEYKYAIWRNRKAIKFIIDLALDHSRINHTKCTLEQLHNAIKEFEKEIDNLEIILVQNRVQLCRMKGPRLSFRLSLSFSDKELGFYSSPHRICIKRKEFDFETEDIAKVKFVDFLNEHQKGKWTSDGTIERLEEEKEKKKQEEAYNNRIKRIIDKEYKKNYIYLSLALNDAYGWDLERGNSYPKALRSDDVAIRNHIFEWLKTKLKQDYNTLMRKTYIMLYQTQKLPLAKLKEAYNDLKNKKEIEVADLYKNMKFEEWETITLPLLEIASKDAVEDIKKAIRYICDNADTYILQMRYMNKEVKILCKEEGIRWGERLLFRFGASHPDLEPNVLSFVQKLIAYNQDYPTFYTNLSNTTDGTEALGVTAVALLGVYNGTKYDKLIANYLETLPTACYFYIAWIRTMREMWIEHNVTEHLPIAMTIVNEIVEKYKLE